MPLIKIWNHDRSLKKVVIVKNLDEVFETAYTKLNYNRSMQLKIVFEADGSEVDSDEVFQYLIQDSAFPKTVLLILPEGYSWTPESFQISEKVNNITITEIEKCDISSVTSASISDEQELCSSSSETCLEDFKIPWESLPPQFLQDCKNGKRPAGNIKREAIRQIITAIRFICKNPPRKFIKKVSQIMVNKYPESLGDIVGNEESDRLFEQLENRLYHLNRSGKSSISSFTVTDDCEEGRGTKAKRKRIRDEYGCVNWQPKEFQEDENSETQKEKKDWLIHRKKLNIEDDEMIETFMNATYISQRLEINKKDFSLHNLYVEWPYLFDRKYLLNHANKLLDFNIEERWREELSKKVPKLIDFMKSLPHTVVSFSRVKDLINQIDTSVKKLESRIPEECSLLIILAKYFGEDWSCLIQFFEKTTSCEELLLKSKEEIPLPVIAVLGNNILEDPEAFVCMAGFIFGKKAKFHDQVIVLFILYYVLNLHYPSQTSGTLEFIQRGLLKIEPVSGGHKREKRGRTSVHPKILSFFDELAWHDSVWSAK